MSQSKIKAKVAETKVTTDEALEIVLRNGGNAEKIVVEVLTDQAERILEHETKHIASRIPVEAKRLVNQIKNLFRRKK